MTGATSGAGTAYPFWMHLRSPTVFSGVRVTRSLALCVMFVDCCLSFFIWTLCCLSFDLWILIIPLVSSNSCLNNIDQQIVHTCTKIHLKNIGTE